MIWTTLTLPYMIWPTLTLPNMIWPTLTLPNMIWPTLTLPNMIWPTLTSPNMIWPTLTLPIMIWPTLTLYILTCIYFMPFDSNCRPVIGLLWARQVYYGEGHQTHDDFIIWGSLYPSWVKKNAGFYKKYHHFGD